MKDVYIIDFEVLEDNQLISKGISDATNDWEIAHRLLNKRYSQEVEGLTLMEYTTDELTIDKQEDYFAIEYGNGGIRFTITQCELTTDIVKTL